MASSTIIELKELQGGEKEQAELPNGFYKQILKNPVTIANGDQLSIHCGFVDTIQSSQGKIDIDGTEDFTIGYTPFIQAYDAQGKVFNGQNPSYDLDSGKIFDNEAYYACAGGHSSTGNLVKVTNVSFARNSNELANWGGVSAYYSFINDQGVGTGMTINIPPLSKDDYGPYNIAIDKICKAGTFQFGGDYKELKRFKRKGHIAEIYIGTTAYTPSALNLEPLSFEFKFKLPKGSYEPKHICELITERLTDMQNTSTTPEGLDNDPVNNAFLKTNQQINSISGTYNGQGKTFYVNSTGNEIIQLPDTQRYPSDSVDTADIVPGFEGNVFASFVGSDQVVLDFDEDLQKCVWSQLHSNIYSEGSAASGSGYNEDGSIVVKSFPQEYTPPGANQKFIYASRNGCIGFNYLRPATFWYDKLGLDPATCFSFETHLTNATLGTITGCDTYRVKGGFIDGIHTTNSVVSSSVAIKKNQFYNQVPTRSNLEGTSTANVKCYALNSLNAPTLEEGYFLISIDGFDNNQKLITKKDEKNTIKSIVSRFYTSNSYTSFYNEGNIEGYTHYGEPITISSFTVRILNPEYESANIQSDNTIFLQLLKPLPQLKQ